MKTVKKIIIVLAFAYLPLTASAWGVIGHRVVGEVADFYLSPKARIAVKLLLGSESMAIAANWSDFVRSDTSYNYMNSWHYVNLDPDMSKVELFNLLEKDAKPNVFNKTKEMIAVLKNAKSTISEKKLALKVLIHLIGDVHQPMHTARKDDLGGNKVSLTWFGDKSNLHKVWDEQLIDFQQLSYTEYAKVINHPTLTQLNNWRSANLKDYVAESNAICNRIYLGIKADDKLSYKYNFDWIPILNEQLLKGGVRLAKILNEVYKG